VAVIESAPRLCLASGHLHPFAARLPHGDKLLELCAHRVSGALLRGDGRQMLLCATPAGGGGILLLNMAYIVVLWSCVQAFGGELNFAAIAVVYAYSTLDKRIAHVVQSCFNGRRLVVFSGGEAKDEAALLAEVTALRNGGASGSIIGRNAFQRKREDALSLLGKIVDIYKG
jgi:hypothetical protein